MPNDEMTTEEFEAMMSERAGKAKRNKFGAVRTQYNGRTYDSKVEARYAVKLDLLKSAGEIRSWIAQPTFKLGEDFTYRADFEVEEQSGKRHVVERSQQCVFAQIGVRVVHVGRAHARR